MKVSVITVMFNSEDTVRDTIESVLAQTFPNIEYIVVDGGSVDRTMEIVTSYGDRIAKVISEPDDGIYHAMNKGIAISTGDIIGFLNADDCFAAQGIIARIVEKMRSDALDVCYGDLLYVERTNLERICRFWQSRKFASGLLRLGWIPAHPTFYAKRELLARGYDLKYRLAADYHLMLSILCQSGLVVGYLPEVLVKMRVGGMTNCSFGNIVRQNMEIMDAAKRCGVDLSPLSFLGRKVLARVKQRIRPAR